MLVFDLDKQKEFSDSKHVEKVLASVEEGDVTVACWEPGQVSPNHCHPDATEIYFCFEGGGKMKTLLFRVRYGGDMAARVKDWPSSLDWSPTSEDKEYFGN